jgi:hypothetical protein
VSADHKSGCRLQQQRHVYAANCKVMTGLFIFKSVFLSIFEEGKTWYKGRLKWCAEG